MARSQIRAGPDQVSGRILTRRPGHPPRAPGDPSQVVGCAYHQAPPSNPVAVAAEADQQLSLAAALGLPEETPAPAATEPAPEPEALASGPSRPRRRQRKPTPETAPAASPDSPTESDSAEPDSDLPAWHHHGLVEPEQLTPMLRHYVELKAAHPDRVLLYRLGDFFECFFEDAITLSRLLELTLTGKEGGKSVGRVPMAGIPHHAAERYCGELVRRGLSVALCDQLETTPAKGELLKRGITRVLTPGTVLEEGLLAARRNNWLCAVVVEGPEGSAARWGLAVADVSTGEFRVTEREGSDALHQELLQVEAAEVLIPHTPTAAEASTRHHPWCPAGLHTTEVARTPFEAPQAAATLRQRFGLGWLQASLWLALIDAVLATVCFRVGGQMLKGPYLPQTMAGLSRTTRTLVGRF